MHSDYLAPLRPLGQPFYRDNWPWIRCPQCALGQLKTIKVDSHQSHESMKAMKHEDSDPEWISGVFQADLKCTNCKAHLVAVGDMYLDPWWDDVQDMMSYKEKLTIRFTAPSLLIMDFPKDFPEEVAKQVNSASAVLFTNSDAAANAIRTSIDKLLTAQKIARYKVNKKGKRVTLSTHDRIKELGGKQPAAAKCLEAVKWIGNDGSHDSGLTLNDVIDGLELLRYAINILYDTHSKKMQMLADKINSQKGIKTKVRKPAF